MKYRMVNIGRNKVTREFEAVCAHDILREVKRYLMSRDVEIIESDVGFNVFAGMRSVGRVEVVT